MEVDDRAGLLGEPHTGDRTATVSIASPARSVQLKRGLLSRRTYSSIPCRGGSSPVKSALTFVFLLLALPVVGAALDGVS